VSSIVKNFDLSRRRLDQLICFAPGSFCAAWRTSEEAVSGTAVPVKRRARKPSLVVLQYQNNTGATMGSTTGASHTVFEDDSSSEVGGVVQDVYAGNSQLAPPSKEVDGRSRTGKAQVGRGPA
jgi:hypothetical protein